MSSKKDELKILIPDEVVETSGGQVTFKPFKFKDFPKALGIIEKYVKLFFKSDEPEEAIIGILQNGGEATLADVSALIELTSGKNREFLDELDWPEVVNLLVALFHQNRDFFYRIGEKAKREVEQTA